MYEGVFCGEFIEEEGEWGGLEESAKSLVWAWILHCRQMEKEDGLNDGRFGTRNVRRGLEKVIESKKSLGTKREIGCIAALPRRVCCCRRRLNFFFEVGIRALESGKERVHPSDRRPLQDYLHPTFFLDFFLLPSPPYQIMLLELC